MPGQGNTLRAVAGGGAASLPLFAHAASRVRPGDRPVWVELNLTTRQAQEWRARSADHGLALDVWLGLLLEYHLVHRRVWELGGVGLVRAVNDEAHRSLEAPRLAPTVELRSWIEQLDGSGRASDDLPSVVLPARLLAQLHHEDRAGSIISAAESGSERDALKLDRVAAAHGLTAEAWAYLAALRASC